MLKADSTWGGTGVRIVDTIEDAKSACRELRIAAASSRSATPRKFPWLGKRLAWPRLFGERLVVNAQEFVAGCDAISEVACWQGKVLASLQFRVLSKQYAFGPASAVRLIENTEMAVAIEKIVRHLGLSGLHGFDFISQQDTGNPHLIEMNPRATQVGHLNFGLGRDLPAALYAAVTQESIRIARKITENQTIALFPQEWARNRASEYLESGYHDVPWEEPELVRSCILSCSDAVVGSSQHEGWIGDLHRSRVPGHGASQAV